MIPVQIKMFTNKDEYGFATYSVRVFINKKPTNYKREWDDVTLALENVGFLESFYSAFNEGNYELKESVV
jgi:hypothetical protein